MDFGVEAGLAVFPAGNVIGITISQEWTSKQPEYRYDTYRRRRPQHVKTGITK